VTDVDAIARFYDENAVYEWQRLERHRTEYAVTLRALHEHLPPPPARLLDVGGGPGRYAIELARQGYEVTLLDLSEVALELARSQAREAGVELAGAVRASALELSSTSPPYAAVLLLGPLYHLLEHEERLRALREASRVLAPEGVLFAAFITRFAPFRDAAAQRPEWLLERREDVERVLRTGVHDRPREFTSAYFVHPAEVEGLVAEGGFVPVVTIGCEGVVAGHERGVNGLSGEAWEYWVDLNYRLGHEPSLYGASDHLLCVARRAEV
jgi:S-adenosylmethionine-dependent methyltransferase